VIKVDKILFVDHPMPNAGMRSSGKPGGNAAMKFDDVLEMVQEKKSGPELMKEPAEKPQSNELTPHSHHEEISGTEKKNDGRGVIKKQDEPIPEELQQLMNHLSELLVLSEKKTVVPEVETALRQLLLETDRNDFRLPPQIAAKIQKLIQMLSQEEMIPEGIKRALTVLTKISEKHAAHPEQEKSTIAAENQVTMTPPEKTNVHLPVHSKEKRAVNELPVRIPALFEGRPPDHDPAHHLLTRKQQEIPEVSNIKATAAPLMDLVPADPVPPFNPAQIETLLNSSQFIQHLNHQNEQLQQNVLQQVFQKIQVIQGAAQSLVTMQLVPEHLGKLTIHLTTNQQHDVTAKIYAQTPHAKEMIESSFGQLRDALSGKGVNLSSLEVFVGQDPGTSERQRAFQFQQSRSRRRNHKEAESVPVAALQSLPPHLTTLNPYTRTDGFNQLG
jgi:flagellar hook-length control protein FliK